MPYNFAEAQDRWYRGDVSLEACFRKGQEHRAYGWAPRGMDFVPTPEQDAAYLAGFNGKSLFEFAIESIVKDQTHINVGRPE